MHVWRDERRRFWAPFWEFFTQPVLLSRIERGWINAGRRVRVQKTCIHIVFEHVARCPRLVRISLTLPRKATGHGISREQFHTRWTALAALFRTERRDVHIEEAT